MTFARHAVLGLSLLLGTVARAQPTEGLSADLLVEAMLADCRKPAPAHRLKAPDGWSYDYRCEDGAPIHIRHVDTSSRERRTFELVPSVLDGQMLLWPTAPANLCGSGTRARRIALPVGWGKLSAACSGGKLEGKFQYRVGESTEEEGAFHQGMLDGDYVQYQTLPIGKHRPERREAHRAGYRAGALDGLSRDSEPNGSFVELSFHDGVLNGLRRAGDNRGGREIVDAETPFVEGRASGTRRQGSFVATFKDGVLQSTNDPAERAANRTQKEDDPDGAFFLESAHAVALPCPAPGPTPPFEDGGEIWDYHCDGKRAEGKVRAIHSGYLRFELEVKDGKLDGPFRAYSAGFLLTEGAFHSGKPNGVFKRYEQGVLVAEKKFDEGKAARQTLWYHTPPPAEQRPRYAATLAGLREACEDGRVEACLHAGEAARALGYANLAEPFFRRACEAKSGLGCARTADDAYRAFDFSRANEAIHRARKFLSEDELLRWLVEEHHLDRAAARGGLINILLPGCSEPAPGRCGRLAEAKSNREGVHQREALRRVRAAKSRQVASLDVERSLLAHALPEWSCREGERVRLAIFRCAWPSPLEWHGASASGLTEGATCLSTGLQVTEALDSVTVVAEHEVLAKLPPLFPEERAADPWRRATVIGCDASLQPARPIVVLD